MDPDCQPLIQIIEELDRVAPSAPLLALGQTIFWDEPVKAGVIEHFRELGSQRAFVAGVHDTDYFAKWPGHRNADRYQVLTHNDTTTKALWTAAGEFSTLFGSETVITKEKLVAAGAKVTQVLQVRSDALDHASEAWGWRGIVSSRPEARITAEEPLTRLFPFINKTLEWAIEASLEQIEGKHRDDSRRRSQELLAMVCEVSEEPAATLASFYEKLLPSMYSFTAGKPVELETTRTTRLLRFNRRTAGLPRFDLVRLFVEPASRDLAVAAYDKAVQGSEIYTLDRFGVGAIPFDLFIPGVGRGTLRLGNRGGVVMTPKPVGFSIQKPIQTVEDFAAIIEKRFGTGCVLIGKAVTLIGMLSREFVLVFHEGASGYTHQSLALHQTLAKVGLPLVFNPILRVSHDPWSALEECCVWLKLPEPLRRPFGVSELSGPSFAARWREVANLQMHILGKLAKIKKPLALIQFLAAEVAGPWICLANEYEGMQDEIKAMKLKLVSLKADKAAVRKEWKKLNRDRQNAEVARGAHWRSQIFEKAPTAEDWAERNRLTQTVHDTIHAITAKKAEFMALDREQNLLVAGPSMSKLKQRRKNSALEAEIARISMIREAVITTEGLAKAGHRPSGWWFPLICPDGAWFRATMQRTKYCLEPLN